MNLTDSSSSKRLKVLLIAEQCNPEWASVPLVAWNYFKEISKTVDVTLVTHERNREAIARATDHKAVVYISEGALISKYYRLVTSIASFVFRGKTNWPVLHVLSYPVYAEFNQKVYDAFKSDILDGVFDVVHALTPMMPRYPFKVSKACNKTPFLLGPVNGGVPFPKGFQEKAREEFSYFNFLRAAGRFLIPGYVETYKKANKILVGSSFTLEMLKQLFQLPDHKISLFYENGIPKNFLAKSKRSSHSDKVNLLFVGRLVPYKCADILIEAVAKLSPAVQQQVSLAIVGEGSERSKLEASVQELNLTDLVKFVGWVDHEETLKYYSQSDIFCFPSIREFGGAVVLEAMACGLPCIVANNGGIGEYVTEGTGFSIEPRSRAYLTQELANKIELLVQDEALRSSMSAKAIARAQEFVWEEKAKRIIETYEELIPLKAAASGSSGHNKPVEILPELVEHSSSNKVA
jgi:glycosyltransferase involved in cell wall biosynthesis